MGGGGVFLLNRLVAVDVGFFRGGVLKKRQSVRNRGIVNDELRKNFSTTGVRFRLPVARFVHLEQPVASFLLTVMKRFAGRMLQQIPRRDSDGVSPKVEDVFPLSPGLASGLDVPIGSDRVAFVPSFRSSSRTTTSAITTTCTIPSQGPSVFVSGLDSDLIGVTTGLWIYGSDGSRDLETFEVSAKMQCGNCAVVLCRAIPRAIPSNARHGQCNRKGLWQTLSI